MCPAPKEKTIPRAPELPKSNPLPHARVAGISDMWLTDLRGTQTGLWEAKDEVLGESSPTRK